MPPNNTPGAMPGQPDALEPPGNPYLSLADLHGPNKKTTDGHACRPGVGGCTAGPTPYEGVDLCS